jgi:hypothetical protein
LTQLYIKIIFIKLTCIPNLQGINGRKYLHSNLNLKNPTNGNYNIHKYNIINQLVLNECYLTHFDKYKHIAVLDIDEAIFPKKTRLFTFDDEMKHISRIGSFHNTKLIQKEQIFDKVQCDRYQNESKANDSKSDLESYLNELSSADLGGGSSPKSFYFSRAFFLRNDLVQSIFRSINHFFTTSKFNHTLDRFNFTIDIFHRDSFNKNRRSKFAITINSQKEFEYARGLLKIHKYIIRSYLAENKNLFLSLAQNFNRFFMLTGLVNHSHTGKTIHNTKKTFQATLHYPASFIDSMSPAILDTQNELDTITPLSFTKVPHELGHVSHFRNFLLYGYKKIPVSALRLDLNYVNCYSLPTIKKFAANREKTRQKSSKKFNKTRKDF